MKTVNILWRKIHIQDTSAHYFRIAGFPGGSDRNNQPAMQETGVRSLGGKDPLEKGMEGLENSRDRGAWWAMYGPQGGEKSDTTEQLNTWSFTAPSEGLESLRIQVKNHYLSHPLLISRWRDSGSERSGDWPKVTQHLSFEAFPASHLTSCLAHLPQPLKSFNHSCVLRTNSQPFNLAGWLSISFNLH